MAVSALTDSAGLPALGHGFEGCWRRLNIEPNEILPAPDRVIDRIRHSTTAIKEEAC
jgi:hypothetical protein